MNTHCTNQNTVDTWYDRFTRSWVTQVKTIGGDQVGDAEYAGNRSARDFNHAQAVKDNGGASGLRWVEVLPDPATLIMALRETRYARHDFVSA